MDRTLEKLLIWMEEDNLESEKDFEYFNEEELNSQFQDVASLKKNLNEKANMIFEIIETNVAINIFDSSKLVLSALQLAVLLNLEIEEKYFEYLIIESNLTIGSKVCQQFLVNSPTEFFEFVKNNTENDNIEKLGQIYSNVFGDLRGSEQFNDLIVEICIYLLEYGNPNFGKYFVHILKYFIKYQDSNFKYLMDTFPLDPQRSERVRIRAGNVDRIIREICRKAGYYRDGTEIWAKSKTIFPEITKKVSFNAKNDSFYYLDENGKKIECDNAGNQI